MIWIFNIIFESLLARTTKCHFFELNIITILILQDDHVNFDNFVKFAVFIENLGYFLF
jgi:hypothetical protein